MENIQNCNIERMAEFIQIEAKQKAEEIRIKAMEDYNTEKAKIIRSESECIEKEFSKKIKNLKIEHITRISDIKCKYRMEYLKKKEEIVNEVIEAIKIKLADRRIGKDIFTECLDSVDEKDVILYCTFKDRDNVKTWAKERKLQFEIQPLDEKLVGGIVAESKDGKTLSDNSWKARLDVIKERNLFLIANKIFK